MIRNVLIAFAACATTALILVGQSVALGALSL